MLIYTYVKLLCHSSNTQGMIVFRAVKGQYWRQLRHKMKALMTMLICYRRKYVKAWFDQVVASFRDCSTMAPDYGRSVKWPKPPPAIIVSTGTL